ncbi:unnamed protein product [Chironomus riparius]|uniref:Cytochrome b5 heme-binding domain-containing protein n=1 Tax=Chironomus riparius TaxID=315576 RepID=A0A9N9X1G7_9DIPT|nr:unnamed protein product [Chironomus riparius]
MTITTATKYYTLKEVREQGNGKNGNPVWIIYKYAVYDCTNYIDKHPGDPSLILDFAGRDCTRDFDDACHSRDAMKELKTLKIGEIVEEDRKPEHKKVTSTQSITSMVSTESEKKRKRRFLLCR